MDNESLKWKDMTSAISQMDEHTTKAHLNFEVSTHKRQSYIKRLHQRYCKLRDKREREQLMKGELL